MRLTKCADKGIASNSFVFIQGQLDSVVHQLSKPLFFESTGPVGNISYEASLGPGWYWSRKQGVKNELNDKLCLLKARFPVSTGPLVLLLILGL